MQTKIDIISGFLGAGKTTLIKKLLKESFSGQKIVIIENEFGEIGIDSEILKQSGILIREINSGCICCTLVGDFNLALKEVLRQYQPDRILIEPSGVGKLSDVMKACKKITDKENAKINLCITVVDAIKYKMYSRNFAEFYNNQVEYAKTVILSRTQKTSAENMEATVKEIREHNPNSTIITTPWDALSGDSVLSVGENVVPMLLNEKELCCPEHEHCHNANEAFDVWSAETPKLFRPNEMDTFLQKLPEYGIVLRAKGIVGLTSGTWLQFDFVPDEISSCSIAPDYTGRLCVIGRKLDKLGLAKLFGVS